MIAAAVIDDLLVYLLGHKEGILNLSVSSVGRIPTTLIKQNTRETQVRGLHWEPPFIRQYIILLLCL